MDHYLKQWPEPFQAVWDGRKRFELRRWDRPFAVGDKVFLREFEPCSRCEGTGWTEEEDEKASISCCEKPYGRYLPRQIVAVITYARESGSFTCVLDAIRDGFGVMSIDVLERQTL